MATIVKKAAVKKKAPAKKKTVIKEQKSAIPQEFTKTIVEIDWEKVPNGTRYTGLIKDGPPVKIEGIIIKEELEIFLLQDEKSGKPISSINPKDYGYDCSWSIGDGSISRMKGNYVEITSMDKPANDFKFLKAIMVDGHQVVFETGYIKVGCKVIKNSTIQEIHKRLKF